jgi:hypothetical protein
MDLYAWPARSTVGLVTQPAVVDHLPHAGQVHINTGGLNHGPAVCGPIV